MEQTKASSVRHGFSKTQTFGGHGEFHAARRFISPAQEVYLRISHTKNMDFSWFVFATRKFPSLLFGQFFFGFFYRDPSCAFVTRWPKRHGKLWHWCENDVFATGKPGERWNFEQLCEIWRDNLTTWILEVYPTVLHYIENHFEFTLASKNYKTDDELNFTDFTALQNQLRIVGSVLQTFCCSIVVPFNFIMAMGISMTPLWILAAGIVTTWGKDAWTVKDVLLPGAPRILEQKQTKEGWLEGKEVHNQ